MEIDFGELIMALLIALFGGSGVVGLIFWVIKRRIEAKKAADNKKKAEEEQLRADAKAAKEHEREEFEKTVLGKLGTIDEAMNDLKAGNLALAHDRLYQLCNYYISRKWLTAEDLRNLEYLYTPYHKLGGNGTCTTLVNKCKLLEIRGSGGDKT